MYDQSLELLLEPGALTIGHIAKDNDCPSLRIHH